VITGLRGPNFVFNEPRPITLTAHLRPNPGDIIPMIARNIVLLITLLLTASNLAQASELVGKWTTEFDSQIGKQTYTYEFKIENDVLTGLASFDHSMGKGEAVLRAIKVSGDDVSFEEPLNFDGTEIVIRYTGKLVGDELKLTREVGDFATEQIVAKRVTTPDETTP